MVRGFVDEHVILGREQPRQRAGRELVAAVAQQVRGPVPHDEVELELGVAMRTRRAVGGHVVTHAAIGAQPESEILDTARNDKESASEG